MRTLMILTLVSLNACASVPRPSPADQKRDGIIQCVKDLKINETDTMEAFEVCRQVYRLKKVK